MAQSIILKRSALQGKVPTTSSLSLGEIAINTYDGKLYLNRSGSIQSIQEIITTNVVNTGSITLTQTGSFAELVVSQDGNFKRDLYVTRDIITNGHLDILYDVTASAFLGAVRATNGVISSSVQLTALNSFTASAAIRLTNLETTSASVNSSITNINAFTASENTKAATLGNLTGSYATTGSNSFKADQQITGSLGVSGDITVLGSVNARQFNIGIISSSVIYQSGSTKFGDTGDDIMSVTGSLIVSGSQRITGSTTITGSVNITGSVTATSFTGSLLGTASFALNGSSNAIMYQTASAASTWVFNHFLATPYPIVTVYDNNNSVIIPQSITANDSSSLTITFSSARTGVAVASKGGYVGSAVATATVANALTTARLINGTSFDGTQNITIPNLVSGSSQISLAGTSDYSSLFGGIGASTSSLNTFSASVSSSIQQLNIFSASNTNTALNTYTSSVLDAKFITLASVTASLNQFTSSINGWSGSIATTGSNSFNGNQRITGSLSISQNITSSYATLTNGIAIGQLSAPTLSSAVTSSAIGGAIPAGTYYYKVTALDIYGKETTSSNEVSTTVTGSTSTITISWAAIAGTSTFGTAYRVYRSTTSNIYGSYVSVSGINTKNFTDTNQAVTSGSIPLVNNSSYGFLDASQLRTNNITLVNGGIGSVASLTFEKSTDNASINVVEYASDSTMFEFKTSDNPDGSSDFFHWFTGDYQNPSSGWKPLKLTNFTNQFVAQNTNFWSSFNLPSNTGYYTTNADTLANAAIKADPYTSNSYSLLKDSGTGTGILNVEISGFTGTSMRTYWVSIASPTTFDWGINSQTYGTTLGTGVTITGAFQTLDNGLQIKLSAGGHVAGDRWAFRAFPTPKFVIGKSTTGNAPFDLLGNGLITGSLGITGSLVVTGSIIATNGITGSIAATNGIVSGSSQISIAGTSDYTSLFTGIASATSSLNSFSASQNTKDSTLANLTGSIETKFTSIGASTSSLNTYTASTDTRFSALQASTASLNVYTQSNDTVNTTQNNRLTALETATGSNVSVSQSIYYINNYTGSAFLSQSVVNARLTALEIASASLELFTSSQNTKNSTLATYTGSNDTKWSNLAIYTASVDTKFGAIQSTTNSLNLFTSSILTALTASGVNLTANGNLTVQGNLTIAGTQTIINSTTVQLGDNIIELNGSSVANGGIYVKDPTAPTTGTGSFIWDSTSDFWKAGLSGSESRILVVGSMGVVSGSSQISLAGTSDYTSLFGGIASTTSSLNSFSASTNISVTNLNSYTTSAETKFLSIAASTASLNTFTSSAVIRLTNLETTSASVNISVSNLNSFSASENTKSTTLATYTGSVDTKFTAVAASTASLNSFTSSAAPRLTNLETTSASVNISVTNLNTYTASVSNSIQQLSLKTGSYATTGSNAFIGNQTISGSLTIGSASVATENTLLVGPAPAGGTGEGGQILLAASGGLYTSASMLDTYQNRFRLLRGTNTASDAEFLNINLSTGQLGLNKYTGSGAFPGASTGYLAVDSAGNVITVTPSSTDLSQLNSFTSSAALRLTNLETTTASLNISVTNLNSYSASVSNSILNLNAFSASNANTSLNTYTGSISDPKFVQIGASTSSLNAFTSSAALRLTNLETTSASVNISVSNLNTYSASVSNSIQQLSSKTGSYATTGSNSFNGNQIITGSLTVTSLTTIATSLTTNSSSFVLTSGSNLIIQNAGLAEITGSLRVSGSTTITGSVSITGSITATSFTGSLLGTASYALNGSSNAFLYQTSSAASVWTFNHYLQTRYPIIQIYDNTDSVIIPQSITAVDNNTTTITFSSPRTGTAVASKGGYIGSVVTSATTATSATSASVAVTSSYAISASAAATTFGIGASSTTYGSYINTIQGANTIISTPTGSYSGAFYKYVATSGSNARAGEVMAIWNNTTTQFTDVTTNDIGSTTMVTSSVSLSAGNAVLSFTTNTNNWNIKTFVTYL